MERFQSPFIRGTDMTDQTRNPTPGRPHTTDRIHVHWSPQPVRMPDGRPGHVRSLMPSDRDALVQGLQSLSTQSRVRRFFFDKRSFTNDQLFQLTHPDGFQQIAFALEVLDDSVNQMVPIAVARMIRDPDRMRTADLGIVVVDQWQNRGAGTLLLRSLAAASLRVGINRWQATALADNPSIAAVLRKTTHIERRRIDPSGVAWFRCRILPEAIAPRRAPRSELSTAV
ncbi:GNAT family N-acetyltransferase [Crateriforma conspicua]|uniref:GNAT family N-acetyltransferase n=1 Tax=Crateriforma conspicua TaxID=2527996 RepID=UPI0011881F45|nr:GNAT family N-acetyltransferase [Crateriforma conspicua]QDV66199.1 Acetyltransferase Pat [Crateriforma conspicua]